MASINAMLKIPKGFIMVDKDGDGDDEKLHPDR